MPEIPGRQLTATPVPVETVHRPTPHRHHALQYSPPTQSTVDALVDFGQGDIVTDGNPPTLWVLSPSAAKKLNPGDWAVRTPSGVSPMTDEVFRATYTYSPEEACVDVRIYLPATPGGVSAVPTSARVVGSNLTPEDLRALATALEKSRACADLLSGLVRESLTR